MNKLFLKIFTLTIGFSFLKNSNSLNKFRRKTKQNIIINTNKSDRIKIIVKKFIYTLILIFYIYVKGLLEGLLGASWRPTWPPFGTQDDVLRLPRAYPRPLQKAIDFWFDL